MGNEYMNWEREAECQLQTAAAAGRGGCGCDEDGMHIWFDACEGSREIAIDSDCHNEESIGRVLDVSVTLRDMCPGRRCAVGVELVEMDEAGAEYPRGFRAFTVPAHGGSQNRDVALPSIRFILPEDNSAANQGCRRHFVARVSNHYVDEAGCGCQRH